MPPAAVDGKLNMQGGVLSRFAVGPDRLANCVGGVDAGGATRRTARHYGRDEAADEPVHTISRRPEAAEFPRIRILRKSTTSAVNGRWVLVVAGGTR